MLATRNKAAGSIPSARHFRRRMQYGQSEVASDACWGGYRSPIDASSLGQAQPASGEKQRFVFVFRDVFRHIDAVRSNRENVVSLLLLFVAMP